MERSKGRENGCSNRGERRCNDSSSKLPCSAYQQATRNTTPAEPLDQITQANTTHPSYHLSSHSFTRSLSFSGAILVSTLEQHPPTDSPIMSTPKSTAKTSLLINDLFSVKGKNVLVTVSTHDQPTVYASVPWPPCLAPLVMTLAFAVCLGWWSWYWSDDRRGVRP